MTEADAETDGAGIGLAVAFAVEIGKTLDKRDMRNRRRILSRVLQTQTVDVNGWIIFPPCSEGKIWHVRNVAVMNTDPWTAGAAGSLAALCIGQADSGNLKLTEVRQPGGLLPYVANYGFDEFPVKTGEQFYIIVHSAGGKEFASVNVEEVDMNEDL